MSAPRPSIDDLIPTERIGIVAWRLAHGEQLTVAQVAVTLGITWQGGQYILLKLSRVLPITERDGIWSKIHDG